MRSYSALCGQGFDFDDFRTQSPPVTQANVAARAQVLVDFALSWANNTAHPFIMLPWGGDFRWQNGSYYFGNMSLVIDHINANADAYGADVRLATVSEYFRAIPAPSPTALAR